MSIRAAAVILSGIAVLSPVTSAQAGFFDFLFSERPRMAAPSPIEAPVYGSRLSISRPRIYHTPHARVTQINGGDAKPEAAPKALLDDHTLRNGDAVMTQDGIRIFTGGGRGRHEDEDFTSLPNVKGLSSKEGEELAAVDAVSRRNAQQSTAVAEVVTGRSVAAPPAESHKPKAKMPVRFVGPWQRTKSEKTF